MLRIHFTTADLLQVRIAEEPQSSLELVLLMEMLQRTDTPASLVRWQRRTRYSIPLATQPLLALVSPQGAGPFFLDAPDTEPDSALDTVMSTPRQLARTELQRMCAIDRPLTPWIRDLATLDNDAWRILARALHTGHNDIITPLWTQLQAGFHADTTWRARQMAFHGLLPTLTGLAPGVRWRGMTLEAPFHRDIDVRLGGQGVTLQPSLFWTNTLLVATPPGRPTVLVYPAVTPLPLLETVGEDPLAALLGRTRTAVLRQLTQQHSTSSLAQALDISLPSASMHARALREAGLIVTQREGKAVCHWCSPLGLDLLGTQGAERWR